MWNEISGRWFERVVAFALAIALTWRAVGIRVDSVFTMANMVDEWLQTGKAKEING